MPIIYPDTSEMEDLSPIDAGTYRGRITAVEAQTSREKGTPMIVPSFKVSVQGKERTRKAFIVTKGPGSFNYDQLLRAVGLVAEADAAKAGQPFDTDALIGKEVNLVVGMGMYNGQPRDQINSYLPV